MGGCIGGKQEDFKIHIQFFEEASRMVIYVYKSICVYPYVCLKALNGQ